MRIAIRRYVMAESLRLHYRYLDAFASCHGACRGAHPPPAHADAGADTPTPTQ